MSGDWQCGKSLAECNQYMLDHEINTDVTFIIPDKDNEDNTGSKPVCFKAHKYMLTSRSPVFYTMFCGEMAEQGEIQVEDAIPEDFKHLLSYIYTDEIEMNKKNIFGILYLSKKYMIPRLTRKCIEYLHNSLTPDNACLIYDKDVLCDDETLMKKCLKMIKIYTKKAFESETMLDIRRETLIKILNCNILMTTESDVFTACVRWAKHQLESKKVEITGENIRNVLGDCIRKIRYANMGNEDFASLVVPEGILRAEEELAIFRYIGNKELHPSPQNFLCTKRIIDFPLEIMVSDQIETEDIADLDVKVTITSDTNIEIKSLNVGRCTGSTEINYIHFDNNRLYVTQKVDVDGNKQELKLGSPLTLQKDQQHALNFQFYSKRHSSKHNKKEPVYVVKTSEIVAADEIVEIKLQSNASFMPLLGYTYTLAIP